MIKNQIVDIQNNNIKLPKREFHQQLFNQRAKVLWFTGLSGSGKSTLGSLLDNELSKQGYVCQLFDGDIIRLGLSKNLTFTIEDRTENIRRISEVAKLFLQTGIISIICFISPTIKIREMAKDIIGTADFIEIYTNSSIETCEKRDVKNLYKEARSGKIKNFTGIDSLYEVPVNPDIEIHTDHLSIEDSLNQLLHYILPRIHNLDRK